MARYRVPVSKVRAAKAKRFGSLKILPDGRFTLHERRVAPFLEYTANRYVWVQEPDEEYGLYDSSNFYISVWNGSDDIFVFIVRRNRISKGWFPVRPNTRALTRSVELIREAGFGDWVQSALENALVSYGSSPYGTPARLRAVRRLIERGGEAVVRKSRG